MENTMGKTVLEWFEEAKANGSPCADAAIKNIGSNLLNSEVASLSLALVTAFIWKKTDEGHSYWSKIYTQIFD